MVPVSCKTNVNSFNLIVNSSKVPSAIKNLIKPKIQAAAEKEVCFLLIKLYIEITFIMEIALLFALTTFFYLKI